MTGTVVGVLRGGPSSEHAASLLSGRALIEGLPQESYTVRDIYIDQDENWFERGRKALPAQILRSVDLVVNATHGAYSEGKLQRLLERFGTRYTGSDAFTSHVAAHAVLAREKVKELRIATPRYVLIDHSKDIDPQMYELTRSFPQPLVVRLLTGSEKQIVGGHAAVYKLLMELLFEHSAVLIEEHIRGTHASVGTIACFRDEDIYALPAAARGEEGIAVPGNFSETTHAQLQSYAQDIHRALGLRHYAQSDFIVTPKTIYYAGTDAHPSLAPESPFAESMQAIGLSMPVFVQHLVQHAA